MPEDQDIERVKKALDGLSEHFDSVHIFCSRHEPTDEGGTIVVNKGVGNWYARYGQVREWVIAQEEGTKISTRLEKEE